MGREGRDYWEAQLSAAFAVTVDAVEKATGLDFFSKVPEEEQDRLERTISVKAWKGL